MYPDRPDLHWCNPGCPPGCDQQGNEREGLETAWAVYYYGRDLGYGNIDMGRSMQDAIDEALRCEDKYAPAQVRQVLITTLRPGRAYCYRGEKHTEEEARADGMLE